MNNERSILPWIIFIGLALVWGSSFILIKKGLDSFNFFEVGAIRLSFAFWFTAIIGFRKFRKLNRKNLFPLILVGFLGNGLPYVLFPIAVSKIDSSVVGVINSLVPLFTLLIGLVIYRFPIRKLQLIGIVVGFIGAFILINPTSAEIGPYWYFTFFAMAASLCYAISINIISKQLSNLDSLSITLLSLLFVGIPATGYLIYADSLSVLNTDIHALENFGYIALLGIVGTSLAVILFNYLIKLTSPVFSSSVTYFIPIIAIVWGWVDGELIGWHTLLGVTGILLGVYLVNKKRIRT